MGLSVLLPEISKDIHLSLFQAGLIWGISSLPGIVTSVIAGAFGDRFGPKRILIVSCLLIGLVDALRGLSDSFLTLLLLVFVFGVFSPVVSVNNFKVARIWFSTQNIGFANGVLSLGMVLGFFLGSLFSTTVLSPWLGGWRNVFLLYGVVGAAFAIPWIFTRPTLENIAPESLVREPPTMIRGISHVARFKNIWLLGLALMSIGGGVQGLLGYLPLYLRGIGLSSINADGAVATFSLVSLICVLPFALWSDRISSRKWLVLGMALTISIGIGLLSFVNGDLIYGSVILAGFARDGFMAVILTMAAEVEGIGSPFVGTAIGFVMIFLGLGNLFAPPLGNLLAGISPESPYLFWSSMGIFGFLCIFLVRGKFHAINGQKIDKQLVS
jgi:MFS family permease